MHQEKIQLNHLAYQGLSIPTAKANLLMIKTEKGFLGCGYFNIEVANKLGEAVALVTGVKSFDDMLNAKVFDCSTEAQELGIKKGMLGRDALPRLHG